MSVFALGHKARFYRRLRIKMPVLEESLQGKDLGHLRIVAHFWGIDLDSPFPPPDVRTALPRLVRMMLNPVLVGEIWTTLDVEAQSALGTLRRAGGRLPWAQFIRIYGPLREMGPAKRDRERPYLEPTSAVEKLFYRGLVSRAFFDSPSGLQEFAYIPSDLLPLLPASEGADLPSPGQAAPASERAHIIPATDHILDHATTLLAALRLRRQLPAMAQGPCPLLPTALKSLLGAAGLLDAQDFPLAEPTRVFLESPRNEALAWLARTWLASAAFNELRLVPNLSIEGEWLNDPLETRQRVLGFLDALLAERTWWSLSSFIAAVYQQYPDFQRPAGDYDSWFIRDLQSGEFLRGFQHWPEIEGALLRFFICGPLHWLGIVDLAAPAENMAITAFRASVWAKALLAGIAPSGLPAEDQSVKVASNARLCVPRLVPRAVRYQIARFAEWEKASSQGYQYRLTAASLQGARQQGLSVNHLLSLLRRHAVAIPPTLVQALERWEKYGSSAHLGTLLVLRLASPEILQALRASRARRFLGDPLGPAAVVVKPGAGDQVLAILAEMGHLGESELEEKDST